MGIADANDDLWENARQRRCVRALQLLEASPDKTTPAGIARLKAELDAVFPIVTTNSVRWAHVMKLAQSAFDAWTTAQPKNVLDAFFADDDDDAN